jgi:membrane protease YdiL (CAAX protease family)
MMNQDEQPWRHEHLLTDANSPEDFGSPAQPRGHALLAWIVITVFVAIIMASVMASDEADPQNDDMGVMMMTFQSRTLIGAAELTNQPQQQYEQATALNTGSIAQRLRFVIVAGDLAGASQANEHLDELMDLIREAAARPEPIHPTPEQEAVIDVLRVLYAASDNDLANVDSLDDAQRSLLRDELGWFGELALAPRGAVSRAERDAVIDGTKKLAIGMIVVMVLFGALAFAGVILIILATIFAATGRIGSALWLGHASHGMYAETFAVWLALFLVLQLIAQAVGSHVPEHGLLITFVFFFASLVALWWPVARGVPWSHVRADIGLTWGKRPMLEPVLGGVGYVMALPIVAVGLTVMLTLMGVYSMFSGEGDPLIQNTPGHPIVMQLADAGWWGRIQVLLVASVAAPVVEEIMFRGVLHRHLRDATRRTGTFISIVLSTTISGFVFAAIHPQGVFAIPLLMSLAYAFSLMREWRGTVVPAIVLHGISNGLVMCLIMVIASAG